MVCSCLRSRNIGESIKIHHKLWLFLGASINIDTFKEGFRVAL
ncbi:unnamed protein product [Rodentolepis nana]|uniref:Uncharacterized protein n=1 Tax=Rodentolepis nana TaxID=102285 RepID=A0A3P7SU20_RODNA|nr:unnamed protein product [Rodentolepis nana]